MPPVCFLATRVLSYIEVCRGPMYMRVCIGWYSSPCIHMHARALSLLYARGRAHARSLSRPACLPACLPPSLPPSLPLSVSVSLCGGIISRILTGM